MSKGGGKSVTTNTSQSSGPLPWQLPYIQGALGEAQDAYYRPSSGTFSSVQNDLLRNAPTYTGNLQSSLSKFGDMYDSTDVNQMLKSLSSFATGQQTTDLDRIYGATDALGQLGLLSDFAGSDPLSDVTVQAIMGQGAGNIGNAWQGLSDVASGSFLNANPYIDDLYDLAARGVGQNYRDYTVPSTDAAFARAGRSGSGSYALLRNDQDQSLGESLNDLATQIYGGNYANERGLMQQAQGLLGTTGANALGQAQQNRLNASQYLSGLGTDVAGNLLASRLNAQQYLSDFGNQAASQLYQGDLAGLNYGLNAIRTAGDPLSDYFDRVGTLYGSEGESTSTQKQKNKAGLGGVLGGLGRAALIGSTFFGNPAGLAGFAPASFGAAGTSASSLAPLGLSF